MYSYDPLSTVCVIIRYFDVIYLFFNKFVRTVFKENLNAVSYKFIEKQID